jgi:hypothetical protein
MAQAEEKGRQRQRRNQARGPKPWVLHAQAESFEVELGCGRRPLPARLRSTFERRHRPCGMDFVGYENDKLLALALLALALLALVALRSDFDRLGPAVRLAPAAVSDQ